MHKSTNPIRLFRTNTINSPDELQLAIVELALDTENPEKNYNLGILYEKIGQTASAINYFYRAAERTSNKDLAYECLLKTALCYERQGNRENTVRRVLQHALCLRPKRPEVYFLLSRLSDRQQQYVDGYTLASIALQNCDLDVQPLRSSVEYPGKYGLIFQKAVCAWWWGKNMESRELFLELANNYYNEMDETHKQSVQRNLSSLGCGPVSVAFKQYHKSKYDKLRFKFAGSEDIEKSNSQAYQDMFILSMLNGKKDGFYLEIGGGDPFHGNNTALLEQRYGWKGVSIEFNPELANKYSSSRSNKVLCENALTIDYRKLLRDNTDKKVIDYLQLDCEPSKTTYDIMTMIPFNEYQFAVITYEHDHYVDMTKLYRDKSRKFLKSKGYELVVNDVSPDGKSTFEDWWVHPDLVDRNIIERMRSDGYNVTHVEHHFITDEPRKKTIIDYFTYFDDTCKELLQLRVNLLKDHVDYFVICESNKTHSGIPIERKLRQRIEEYGLPREKIIIIDLHIPEVEDLQLLDIDYHNSGENSGNINSVRARARERLQRDALQIIIDKFDNDTYFIVGDCDEIIDPSAIDYVLTVVNSSPNNIIKIPLVYLEGRADLRVYNRITNTPKEWNLSLFVCTKRHLTKTNPINIRCNYNNPFPIVWSTHDGKIAQDLGWHFSWMGGAAKRKLKRDAFCHYEDNLDFLESKTYNDEKAVALLEQEFKEGSIAPSLESDSILIKYDTNNLPKQIFEMENVNKFLFP